MDGMAEEPEITGLPEEERRAVETFCRAFAGRPDLLDQAVTEDWHTHAWHLEDWFGWLNQVGAWPVKEDTR